MIAAEPLDERDAGRGRTVPGMLRVLRVGRRGYRHKSKREQRLARDELLHGYLPSPAWRAGSG